MRKESLHLIQNKGTPHSEEVKNLSEALSQFLSHLVQSTIDEREKSLSVSQTDEKPKRSHEETESGEIPFWCKYILTITEAAKYFGIGENRIRRIVKENQDAEFVARKGSQVCIKRIAFEKYLDGCQEL